MPTKEATLHGIVQYKLNGLEIVQQTYYEENDECQSLISPQIRRKSSAKVQALRSYIPDHLKELLIGCQRSGCSPVLRSGDARFAIILFDSILMDISTASAEAVIFMSASSNEWTPCSSDVSLSDINALILGSSGIGKSTLINSILNYLNFGDLNEALKNAKNIKIAIPGKFTANGFAKVNEANELEPEINSVIRFGDQSAIVNENVNDRAESDSRGVQQDNKNSDHIISYISNYTYLSAIFFVMRPNEERLTSGIMYTFIETFSRLNKALINNIFLLFTTSSTTNYELAGTRTTIEELQRRLKIGDGKVNLLNPEKLFFFDNADFRLVCAKAEGRVLSNDKDGDLMKANETHWSRSSQATHRLIYSLLSIPAVCTIGIKKLNETKLLVQNVSEVLVKISTNIDKNIDTYNSVQKIYRGRRSSAKN
ncbi:hypothetical protein HK098_000687 [Nowakowskiella sp. JEL0407]|nr:hypothetical protein HK098_000687 [Nowakowskiella sp. JEL0407]